MAGILRPPSDPHTRPTGSPPGRTKFEITGAGEVTVHGLTKIRSDQAWFWTPEWQEGERRTSEDIAAGRTAVHEDTDSMFAHLDED
ncbi:AbrB/MazE/SpoVT family DNA-binding domain-containing protein [Streptomyces clavifer]|uniref:AbrB/MazE/SpoVT family DNA-binding domain-containing protein n=1 Tax=Streptomyces clavifer TaxID=68188 RepID=UPI0037B4D909